MRGDVVKFNQLTGQINQAISRISDKPFVIQELKKNLENPPALTGVEWPSKVQVWLQIAQIWEEQDDLEIQREYDKRRQRLSSETLSEIKKGVCRMVYEKSEVCSFLTVSKCVYGMISWNNLFVHF